MKIDSSISQINSFRVNAPSHKQEPETTRELESNLEERQLDLHRTNQAKKEKEDREELSKTELEHVVKGLNELLKPKYTSLSFKLHEELERYYVEVVDEDTKKVVREIPSKELLDMYAKMTEFLGLFVDRKL